MTTLLKTLAIALILLTPATTSPLHAMDPTMQRQYDQAIRETPPGDYQTRPVTKFSKYSAPFHPTESPLQAKLRRIVIPTFECRDSTIHDALRQLADQCTATDHARERFTFAFDPNTETEAIARRLRDHKISLNLQNASVATIIDRLLEQADLWYVQTLPTEFLVGALPDEPADTPTTHASQPLTPEEQRQYTEALKRGSPGLVDPNTRTVPIPVFPAKTDDAPPTPTKQTITERLAQIRIPRLDLSESTGINAFRVLRNTIADQDPKGGGIRFTFDINTLTLLEGQPGAATGTLTAALRDTTAAQALDYITTALHLQYHIQDGYIQISPTGTQPPND